MFKLIKMFLIILAITGYSYVKAINNHIPIVFIHKNDSFYLKDVFSQAKKFKNNLILLGDDQNNKYDQVSHFKINNYLKSAKYFSKFYVHSSPNKFNFELFCFERWFILNSKSTLLSTFSLKYILIFIFLSGIESNGYGFKTLCLESSQTSNLRGSLKV